MSTVPRDELPEGSWITPEGEVRLPPEPPAFGVTRHLIRRLAPPQHNLIFELLLSRSRRGRFGLNDRTLLLCCALSVACALYLPLFTWVLLALATLYLSLMLPAFRFWALMRANSWAEDLLITPMPSRDYATGFLRFFLVAAAFVFIPYLVFLYLGYFCGLQWQGLQEYYFPDVMLAAAMVHVVAACGLWMLYWGMVAGRLLTFAAALTGAVGLWTFFAPVTLSSTLFGLPIHMLTGGQHPGQYQAFFYGYRSHGPLADPWLQMLLVGIGPYYCSWMLGLGFVAYLIVRNTYVRRLCRILFP